MKRLQRMNDHDGPLDMTSTSPTGRCDVTGGLGIDGRSDAASPSSNNDTVDVDTIQDDLTSGSLGGLAPDQVRLTLWNNSRRKILLSLFVFTTFRLGFSVKLEIH